MHGDSCSTSTAVGPRVPARLAGQYRSRFGLRLVRCKYRGHTALFCTAWFTYVIASRGPRLRFAKGAKYRGEIKK